MPLSRLKRGLLNIWRHVYRYVNTIFRHLFTMFTDIFTTCLQMFLHHINKHVYIILEDVWRHIYTVLEDMFMLCLKACLYYIYSMCEHTLTPCTVFKNKFLFFLIHAETMFENKLGLCWAKLSSNWNWNFVLLLLRFVEVN